VRRRGIELVVPDQQAPSQVESARDAALDDLVRSAADNIPGVDVASISLRGKDGSLSTLAATDQVAHQVDQIQYQLSEGPCYAAVTGERLVLVNDLASASEFPRYGKQAFDYGMGSQLAIQLLHNGEQAGLNLYARQRQAFDRATVELAELFATQAGAVLKYATQAEQLTEAVHTRTDIGTAVGIVMERYGIDRERAFAFLVRNSNQRNIKLRHLAQEIIAGTFQSTAQDLGSHDGL
jgi:GAF domain-containing protein